MWSQNKDKQVDLFCDAKGAKQTTPTMGNVIGNSVPSSFDTLGLPSAKPQNLRYFEVEVMDNRGGIHVGWVREDCANAWMGKMTGGIGSIPGTVLR